MADENLQSFLAQLLVDASLRERFLRDPAVVAGQFGLSPDQCRSVAMIPSADLQTAACSYERKRMLKEDRGYLVRAWMWVHRHLGKVFPAA